jgi:hypothetical protein
MIRHVRSGWTESEKTIAIAAPTPDHSEFDRRAEQ